MKNRTSFLAVAMLGLWVATASANHRLEALRVRHENQCRQLRYERKFALKQARQEHRAVMERLDCALRDAHRLCEPQKSAAIHRIHWQRRTEIRRFHNRMDAIRTSYDVAIRECRAAYRLACQQVRVRLLPCGCPVNHCSCRPSRPVGPPPLVPYGAAARPPWLVPDRVTTTTARVIVPPPVPRRRVEQRPIMHMITSLLAQL